MALLRGITCLYKSGGELVSQNTETTTGVQQREYLFILVLDAIHIGNLVLDRIALISIAL
jgi:hypothetical protein